MRRYADPDWGQLQPVDFDTKLGNTVSLYLKFSRPLIRTSRFEVGYSLASGLGYSHHKYNKDTDPDNEFIGSRWLIYFATSIYASWRFADDWALKGAVDFYHHSNGALNRPNKGSNTLGPSFGVVYMPYYEHILNCNENFIKPPFKKYFYLNFTAGIGGKVLHENWQLTQFNTAPYSQGYRTGRFHFYTAYSFQADCMYRYARRWASGLGADLFMDLTLTTWQKLTQQMAATRNTVHGRLALRRSIKFTITTCHWPCRSAFTFTATWEKTQSLWRHRIMNA